jgi:hypothetical protein
MTDQAIQHDLARRVLAANALFSALSGVGIIIMHRLVGPHFGLSSLLSSIVLVTIGVLLVGYAFVLDRTRRQPRISRGDLAAFATFDTAWVVGSALLLLLAWGAISTTGRVLVFGIAVVVGSLAGRQFFLAYSGPAEER